MFYSLTGKLEYADASFAVINCGGVGFKCAITRTTLASLPKTGETVKLFTHLNVREDALDLFGFYEKTELDFFRLLTSVSGIGPKAGLSVLSEMPPEKLAVCIATGDAKAISRANGVGGKTAQRIIMELKDKIGSLSVGMSDDDIQAVGAVSASSNAADAVNALVTLGYNQSEASLAIGRLDGTLPTSELIKLGLKKLSEKI